MPSSTAAPPADPPPAARARGGMRVAIPGIVIALAMLGSIAYIGYVVLKIRDNQLPQMAIGFVVLGASLAAIALWALFGIWKAASRARGGRAMGLAIVGGFAGLGAIGCFAVAALSMLVLNT